MAASLFLLTSLVLQVASVALGQTYSVESYNAPKRFIRHRNSLGYLEPINSELDKLDSTFKIAQGLAKSENIRAVSFESVNFPGYYLRHSYYRIKLERRDGSILFDKDATYIVENGNADGTNIDLVSFRSINRPSTYIRHRGSELWIDPANTSLAREDSTFKMIARRV